jgi:nucleoside-diphosphate-sugar epimerase
VDTVISTISGTPQLALIDAAANVHVRRFVPSEFEGSPALRPVGDVLDRGKRAALQRLEHYQPYGMDYTTFTCGIFYERFAPGGMGSLNIGLGSGVAGEGDYIMDIRRMKASVPHYNNAGHIIHICLTSAQDVARFVVAALDLPNWPTEFRMRGDRLSVLDAVQEAESMRGKY